jgi:hypothetical protein
VLEASVKGVFVSRRGEGAVSCAAWLDDDLAEQLGGDRVVAEGASEPGDIHGRGADRIRLR